MEASSPWIDVKRNLPFHFIYEVKCNVTGEFYRGKHSTDDLNDGYLGSGRWIRDIDAVKKLIKSNDESLKHRASEKLVTENAVLAALLPKQLTEDQIRNLIDVNSLVGVPAVMQFLNSNYAGQFDKGLASSIARS